MLRFLDGYLLGTTSSVGAAPAEPPAGGGGAPPPAAAAAAPASAPFAFPTDKPFAEYLPKEIAGEPSFKDVKSFEDLAKGYLNAQKMVGLDKNKLLALPKDDNDNDALTRIYTSLGRPEKVDGYQIPKLADGKDYSDGDKAFQAVVLPVLHDIGLSQRQVAQLVPKWNEIQAAAQAAQAQQSKAAFETADKALRTEFGAAYEQKVGLAKEGLDWLANDEKGPKLGGDLKAWLESPGPDGKPIGNDPRAVKLFAFLAGNMKEDGLIGKGGAQQGNQYSPNEAQQQIAALQSDQTFLKAYTRKDDPGHAGAVERMRALYEQAYPEPAEK